MTLENKILLVGIDLDGTLLRNDKTISERTAKSLINAAERGIHIVPVTGRPLSGIPKCITDLGVCDYAITTNGAVITRLKTGECIYSAPIEHEKAVIIMSELEKNKIDYETFADGAGYLKPSLMAKYHEKYGGSPVGEYIRLSRKVFEDPLDEFKKQRKCADEIFIICESSHQRELLAAEFRKNMDVQICLLEDTFLEITRRGTDKGCAFDFLRKHLGILSQNTAAFGDNANDLALLEAAGVSVAMGNASDYVKQRADMVADTNEKDGVAKLLDRF